MVKGDEDITFLLKQVTSPNITMTEIDINTNYRRDVTEIKWTILEL